MKCPHCSVEVHDTRTETLIAFDDEDSHVLDGDTVWLAYAMQCPSCKAPVIYLGSADSQQHHEKTPAFMAYPRVVNRPKPPQQVPVHIAEDYVEACLVLSDSPKASAALSRRCLQTVLREHGYAQRDLAPAIQAALDSGTLPALVAESLDAIRNVGNFAAHPMKDTNTGAILPVEAEEAEWNLEVLSDLFDFYYVQPARVEARRAALNAKLESAGKPPMK
ncbi:DUF4145 domain-containing protein [Burkholderia stagnalis]|uniref:DUF4145 domain-containing protein n=1 Tax=Burkholderia stagnalis TaxID=1503054 RepID=UPI0007C6D20B|nr:DUF4145 domain-containing protein [Burkholderia stagnalis]